VEVNVRLDREFLVKRNAERSDEAEVAEES
jgi:hypothetical protein